MKNLLFFFLLLSGFLYSQNTRFAYSYRAITDTLKKDVISEEIVVLDFNGRERRSLFTSLKHIISDSSMVEMAKIGKMILPDGSTNVRYVIEKDNTANSVFFYTPNHSPEPLLKVKDERYQKWEIVNEQKKILGYNAQKATVDFGGRKWTAWYTDDIPISDGPYFFHGLPGLILQISDNTETHSFEILSIQKQKSTYNVLGDETYSRARSMTSEDYRKLVIEERKNPLGRVRNGAFNGKVIFKSPEEKQYFLKNIDAQIKEKKIHDNNPIELEY